MTKETVIPRLFINYRTEDAGWAATLLERELDRLLEPGQVFIDHKGIGGGESWRRRLHEEIDNATVMFALIGQRWLSMLPPERDDCVLWEIERALDREIVLVPVLVDDASLPSEDDLPGNLTGLLSRQARCLRRSLTDDGLRHLSDLLKKEDFRHRQQPLPNGTKLYNVPTGSVRFVGRTTELDNLCGLLLGESGDVAVSTAIEGLAGIGKTETAIQLAHRLAAGRAFPGGVFWLDVEENDLTQAWAADSVAGALGVAGKGPVDVTKSVIRRLNQTREPILIVLDNVATWSRDDRPEPLPTGEHVRLLITTRQRRLGASAFEHVELGFLDRDSAAKLLADVAGRDIEPGVDALLESLDGHALAIELAGAYLDDTPVISAADYLVALQAGRDLQADVADATRYERTVQQALRQTWDRLDAPTQQAWRVASCLAPTTVGQGLSDAIGVDAEAQRALRRFHLISFIGDRWHMHRLVSAFGQTVGTEDENRVTTMQFLEGCVTFVYSFDLPTAYKPYRSERSHLQLAESQLSVELLGPERYSQFLDDIGTALQSSGELLAARHRFELALAISLKTKGEGHPVVATRRSNLGLVLRDLDDLVTARQLFELALDSDLETYGEHSLKVANRRNNLGLVLLDLGDPAGARRLFDTALKSMIKHQGEDHAEVAASRNNLGMALHALGDLARAKMLFELALASDLARYGSDHPVVAKRHSNLATVLRALGDLQGAKQLLERALAATIASLGKGHPTVTRTRNNLEAVLRELEGSGDGQA